MSPKKRRIPKDGAGVDSDKDKKAFTKPALPEPDIGLKYEPKTGYLYNKSGWPVYQLNSAADGWIPLVSPNLASLLPLGTQPVLVEDYMWGLYDDDNQLGFYWDDTTHSWIALSSEKTPEVISPVAECPGALPARLSPGDQADVVSNLNIRSSPGILGITGSRPT